MHYFEYNIKDYRADAFQLTLIQHGAYKQLMDQYYLNESPLALDLEGLFYDLLIRGEDEKKAIVFVLWNKVRDANALPQECERNANQEPLTINKKTKTKVNTPEGVDTNLWNDYLQIRKAKKAPITDTAIQALVREADKAGKSLSQAITICVENNWVGFKAEWESVKQAPSDQPMKWPGK